MRHSEEVTFGGSGLDRAAGLRGKPDELAALWPKSRVLCLWKGRPLTDGTGLGWVPPDSPVLLAGLEACLFLGKDEDGQAYFAQDISAWQPEVPATIDQSAFFDPSRQTHPALPDTWAFQELRGVMAELSPRDGELAATARALLEWHARHGFCAACGAKSDISMAGWQRSCSACRAQHFPRTDPVVIMLIERGNRLLLGRGKGWPDKMYSCLAGFVEPGETIEAAVRREVFEESGIRVGPVRYLASQPWPFPASLMMGCHGQAISDEITIDPDEIEDARWVTREEMLQAFAGTHPDIRPSRKGAIAQFLIANWLADRLD